MNDKVEAERVIDFLAERIGKLEIQFAILRAQNERLEEVVRQQEKLSK